MLLFKTASASADWARYSFGKTNVHDACRANVAINETGRRSSDRRPVSRTPREMSISRLHGAEIPDGGYRCTEGVVPYRDADAACVVRGRLEI